MTDPLRLGAPLPLPPAAEPALPTAADMAADPARSAEACQQFEAFFIQQLFAQMRRTVDAVNDKTSFGSSYFHGMLDEQLAQGCAAAGGFGLTAGLADFLQGPQVAPKAVDDLPEGRPQGARHED